MELIVYKALALTVIFLLTFITALVTLKWFKNQKESIYFHLSEAFAGGIFLGLAVFHILPQAYSTFKEFLGEGYFFWTSLIVLFGFLIWFFLEKIVFAYLSTSTSSS